MTSSATVNTLSLTRIWTLSALVAAVVTGPNSVDAFAHPKKATLIPSCRISSSIAAKPSHHVDDTNQQQLGQLTNPFADLTRPIMAAAAPLILSASLVFAPPPLSPSLQAIEPANAAAAAAVPTTISSPTATSIEIDLKGLPALTRKAIANRDQLQKYLIESASSFQPILRLLSESDTVTVTPPQDVKKAINSLLGGEAQFVINKKDLIDVRVESVPGVIVVRIINPKIPRLPFLPDGSAAIRFVDQIVDVAPRELEKASEEVLAVEKFLTWGAPSPEKKQITFGDSQLGRYLSSPFEYNGKTVSLGTNLGDLTNSQVVIGGLGLGVAGVYGASYAYYVQLKEDAEREAEEKKAAKKAKAVAPAAAKPKLGKEVKVVDEVPKPVMTVETMDEEPVEIITDVVEEGYSAAAASRTESSTITKDAPKKTRKRDAIKNLFKRGN